MSHALLLRLFLSPSFFSVHVALQYLRTYGDHIGITHYLAGKLREVDPSEVEGLWGLVCHLLVTRPSKSAALECFVLERAEESAHIAMMTLWFMQASLVDLSITKRQTPSFSTCQRVLNRCHAIVFHSPLDSSGPYSSYQSKSILAPAQTQRYKVKRRPRPALVGMGSIIGAVGMPQLREVGEWAVKQGAAPEEGKAVGMGGDAAGGESPGTPTRVYGSENPPRVDASLDEEDELEADVEEDEINSSPNGIASADPNPSLTSKRSTPSLRTPPGPPTRRAPGPHQTSPSLPFTLPSRPHLTDPLGQLEPAPPNPTHSNPTSPSHQHSRFSSSPSIPSALRHSSDTNLLARYPNETQVCLLKAHYFRSQLKFLLALESISHRLLVIPKPARVSALRAELTSLNHQLPSEICLPIWCPSTDTSKCRAHHRVVRIPPGECVVLNSAERAPYLLLVEILQGDLDFEPSKRGNKELLRKIVMDHQTGRPYSEEPNGTPKKEMTRPFTSVTQNIAMGQGTDAPQTQLLAAAPILTTIPPTPAVSTKISLTDEASSDDEEMDLVEQLYGSDLSVRTRAADLTDSIVLPAPLKNKALDIAAWSKSNPSSPRPDSVSESTPRRSLSRGAGHVNGRDDSSLSYFPSPSVDEVPPTASSPMLSLEDYSERMRTAAVMLAQLNASVVREPTTTIGPQPEQSSTLGGVLGWIPGSSLIVSSSPSASIPAMPSTNGHFSADSPPTQSTSAMRLKLNASEAAAIRNRIMKEMMSLEEERMQRMREGDGEGEDVGLGISGNSRRTAEDETIVRRELNKSDPSAAVFKEAWAVKKARIRASSPYGHLASWECLSLIVKTGADLRQEQLATQLIREFERIWREENCACWSRSFHILITGGASGLVETVTDAVSIHSIKKTEYAKRLAEGRFGTVTLMDHFVATYGEPSSPRFIRAQRNFARSLAGYSVITFLLQIKDRHNGNILLDRDGHLIHIDFGFMLSNSPGGNMGFEAAPFKLPMEYLDVLGGMESKAFKEFKTLFREGFEAARKHCDSIITIVELMQKDSALPCFAPLGEQTANALRERFQPALTHSLVGDYVERLILSSMGSTWTRLYDSYQYYSQSIL